jgi:hypothetical protein
MRQEQPHCTIFSLLFFSKACAPTGRGLEFRGGIVNVITFVALVAGTTIVLGIKALRRPCEDSIAHSIWGEGQRWGPFFEFSFSKKTKFSCTNFCK